MDSQKKYDVFISCKSEDYALAREIHDFLTNKGYSVFLADADLRRVGRARYGKVIDEALESATHLVLFASKPSYAVSTYVEEEWRIFMEEQRSGRKLGNLLTVRKGFDIAELPISLRSTQSFTFDEYKSIVDFLPMAEKRVVPQRNRVYKIGDYYDDGKKQGVVFEVTADGQHGKIVSLIESDNWYEWSKGVGNTTVLIGADSTSDGAKNMAKVKQIAGWREKYPAFAWCADLGEGWYLPAIEELKKFTLHNAVHDAVNRTLETKGTKLANKGDEHWYWSSTENETNLFFVEFCAWYVRMSCGNPYVRFKDSHNYVRAVSAF
ncbi:MAG: TIR domain-containing protein [Alistipes sp.]|nr:TIR domain-containing protein [Alistipes sp.]